MKRTIKCEKCGTLTYAAYPSRNYYSKNKIPLKYRKKRFCYVCWVSIHNSERAKSFWGWGKKHGYKNTIY